MKRVPLYRAPIAGLMSLTLATSILPSTEPAEPPHADNPDDKDQRHKDDRSETGGSQPA